MLGVPRRKLIVAPVAKRKGSALLMRRSGVQISPGALDVLMRGTEELVVKIYVELAEDIYPAYKVRDVQSGPPVNKITEVMIGVHKSVFYRWLRTITEYTIVQEEIAEKLKELREQVDLDEGN